MPKPKRQLIAEEWNDFSRRVLAPNAPNIQRSEMRLAFFAGAQTLLFKVMQALAPEDEVMDEDLQLMQDIYDELEQFNEDVKKEKE